MTEELHIHHDHDDSRWQLPGVPWAPQGDSTVATRLLAATKERCEECVASLTIDAAQNGDTLAVVLALTEHMLGQPEGRGCVRARALQEVSDRIKRMRNPQKSTVVGMLRTLSDNQRLNVAAGCAQALQHYMTGVYEKVHLILEKRQQGLTWLQ